MKRRSLRGNALMNRLAQSLVARWGSDYIHTCAYTHGTPYFREECMVQLIYQTHRNPCK